MKKRDDILIEYNKARDLSEKEIGSIVEKAIMSLSNKYRNPNEFVTKTNYLEIIFALQADFAKKWIDFKNKDIHYREERTQAMILALIEETIELKRNLNLKEWRKKKKKVDINKVREELVDMIHFTVNIALIWGLTPTSLFEAFIDKQKKNRIRQKMHY